MTTDHPELTQALAAKTDEIALLKHRLQSAERLRGLLDGVVGALLDRPAFCLSLLEKEKSVTDTADEALKSSLRDVWRECAERTQAASRELVRTFPDQLEELGLTVDDSSRHPRYSVGQRLVDVELDTRGYLAVIRPRHGQVVREPLDPAYVAARVRDECQRLLDRPFDERAFLKKLRAAYAVLSKPKKGVPITAVLVRDLATQIAKPGKPKLDEFAVDLGRLLTSGSGQALLASHTRDTDKGLLLYGLEQGGYVGSIEIRGTA